MTTKLSIETKFLKEIFNLVAPATDQNSSNVLAASFLVEIHDDKIIVRGNNTLIEAVYTFDGAFELDGEPIVFCAERFIYDIINKCRTKSIDMTFEDGHVIIKSGKAKHKVALIDHVKFPDILDKPSELKEIENIPEYVKLFKDTSFSLSTQTDWEILQSYKLSENQISSTNKFQAMFINYDFGINANPHGNSLLTILKAVDYLDDEDKLFVHFTDKQNYIKFVMAHGVLEYNLTVNKTNYPNTIDEILYKAESNASMFDVTLDLDELKTALDECLLYYSKAGSVGEVQFFTIKVDGESVKFNTEIPSIANLDLNVDVKELNLIPDKYQLHLDPKQLYDFVKLVSGDVRIVQYQDEERCVIVYDTNNIDIKYLQVTLVKED